MMWKLHSSSDRCSREQSASVVGVGELTRPMSDRQNNEDPRERLLEAWPCGMTEGYLVLVNRNREHVLLMRRLVVRRQFEEER
jgi:hypothetical protein